MSKASCEDDAERPNNNRCYYSFEVQSCPHRLRVRLRVAPSHGQVFPTADFPDPHPLDKRVSSPGVFTYPIITGEIWLSTRWWKSVPWIFAIKRAGRITEIISSIANITVQSSNLALRSTNSFVQYSVKSNKPQVKMFIQRWMQQV